MGFGRYLAKNLIPGYRYVSIGKKIIDEGFVEGIKSEFKEDIQDDPITGTFYNMGKDDGKRDGYIQASNEFEEKFVTQVNKFLEQKELLEKDIQEYEELLDAYEQKIEELQSKNSLSYEENMHLQQLLITECKLLKLK